MLSKHNKIHFGLLHLGSEKSYFRISLALFVLALNHNTTALRLRDNQKNSS